MISRVENKKGTIERAVSQLSSCRHLRTFRPPGRAPNQVGFNHNNIVQVHLRFSQRLYGRSTSANGHAP